MWLWQPMTEISDAGWAATFDTADKPVAVEKGPAVETGGLVMRTAQPVHVSSRKNGSHPLHPANQEFALVDEFLGQVALEVQEELFVRKDFLAPGGAVEVLQLVEFLL